jgi:transcriptional regulator with XRE-family HTH domain
MTMETGEAKPHIGKKIERIRIIRGIKQETLAAALGVTQGAISRMEHSETVEDDKLVTIAGVLGVDIDTIKNFDETTGLGSGTFFNNQSHFQGNAVGVVNHFNPIDKVVALYESTIQRLERENEQLHKLIDKLTEKL